jgi:DNA-binding XRE family transcriptional regulator
MVFDYDAPHDYHFGMGALTKLRKAARLSQSQLAELVGTSQPQIQRLEKGTRGLSKDWATRIAPHLGAMPADLMFGDRTVALVGHVGAGSEAHYYADGDAGLGRAKMPPNGSESTVAVRVRGDSLGAPFDGWVIYYDNRRDPPTDDLLGELCVVGLPSGQVLVKKLMRGRVAGHYDLWPVVGAPQTDQLVEWAAKVTNMSPASEALVEEPQDSPSPVRRTKRSKK